ncbi:MAG: hypothetical protein C4297_11210 [Gemmataceae bacterium]
MATGPASATHIMSRKGRRSRVISTGTGLAPPNIGSPLSHNMRGTRIDMMGSMCRKGSSVIRP